MADDNTPPQIQGPVPNLQSLPNLGPTPQQQISQLPQLGQQGGNQQDDPVRQMLLGKVQQASSAQFGVKQMLQNFFSGMSHGMLPVTQTPEFQTQRALTNLATYDTTQANTALHRQMASQYEQVPLIDIDGKPIAGPDGKPVTLPGAHAATWYAARTAAIGRAQAAETSLHKPINVPGVGAFNWDDQQNKYIPVEGTQGATPTVDHDTAQLSGLPQLEGQPANAQTWSTINKALMAKGFRVQDMAANGTGPNQGMWLMDRAGTPIRQVSSNSLVYQRGASFAQNRAAYTPFETVEPGTNIPETISNLQALQSGAPRVTATQAGQFGTKYAQFNDAYGILDNIDRLTGQVNLSDPTVRGRVTAGYAALKEPATNGLAGEVLSNFFARQPIYGSLQPDERGLVLAMAQGKAAATGLRGILGQAGTNEMQQRLDAGMMPGGQTIASAEGIKQQTTAMRGLLDRFVVGQPQVGLNAPGTSTAINKTPPSKPATSAGGFAAWKAKQSGR